MRTTSAQTGPPEIIASAVRKSFHGREVLKGISATVRAGEILAIVGGSGCGKTVLLNHLVGLLRPDSGSVHIADHDAPLGSDGAPPMVDLSAIDEDELDRIRLHWAVIFQRNALFSGTVEANIALWLREHTDLSEERVAQRSREALAAVQLDPDDVLPKQREQLSGGMAKRVAIARGIAVQPLVIFYDEPTTGLDPVVGAAIHDLIWRTHHLPGERGTRRTSVIVTHDRDLLRRIRPRVLMLEHGAAVFEGPYDEFSTTANGSARRYLAAMPVLHARDAE